MSFPASAATAYPVFYRTYSRFTDNGRESWQDVCDRTVKGLAKLGKLTREEADLIKEQQQSVKALPSGRWLWCGGTAWLEKKENYIGAYNCSSLNVIDWHSFGLLMNMAMQGCGTGAVLEAKYINQLPKIVRKLNVTVSQVGWVNVDRQQETSMFNVDVESGKPTIEIVVGDSRQGWALSYQLLLELASHADESCGNQDIDLLVNLHHVRPAGERLKGFGGVANPAKLPELYTKIAAILNNAHGRKLNSLECCRIIDEAALVVVAGNVRRSAGIRQFDASDNVAATAKLNLWQQNEVGDWGIDPERDALRMANHTRVFHQKPTRQDIGDSVKSQYYSGEGAIEWAGEAVARANADLITTPEQKTWFLNFYDRSLFEAEQYLQTLAGGVLDDQELEHRMSRYALNPCGEIVSTDFLCNLSEVHLNQLKSFDHTDQEKAFRAATLAAAALLHHDFIEPRQQYSREKDPIVGVSITGLFDYFVNMFGANWLEWWGQGRPMTEMGKYYKKIERKSLHRWKGYVESTLKEYCNRHKLRMPNRFTTVQPSGTKSLLSGASPGFHPPKAARYIRRITFAKNDPVALACIEYGYNVIPSQADRDINGQLLDDPHDPNCTEWLIEIPVEVPWANMPDVDSVDIDKFSALAQIDFLMQVQQHYAGHNVSATVEIRESEIEQVSNRIHEAIANDEGYVSLTLLARFDDLQTYPRLPFEPISKDQYIEQMEGVLNRRSKDNPDFGDLLVRYDHDQVDASSIGPAGCDSSKCLIS